MTTPRPKITGQAASQYGEHRVQAELERYGWATANLNTGRRNFPGYDLFARKGTANIIVDVKTARERYPRGKEKYGGAVAKGSAPSATGIGSNEYTIYVFMGPEPVADQFYIVPTHVVRAIQGECWDHYYKTPKADGGKRKDSGHLTLHWGPAPHGEDRPGWGLAKKWVRFLDGWNGLPESAAG